MNYRQNMRLKLQTGLYKFAKQVNANRFVSKNIPTKYRAKLKSRLSNKLYQDVSKNQTQYQYSDRESESFQNALVSVILPTYNQSEFLEQAINSILKQTYSRFELIIINDGSTDQTSDLLKKYENFSQIRIYEQPNQGLPSSLNSGLAKANGQLITWTSSDNVLLSGALEALVTGFAKYPEASLVYGDYQVIDEYGVGLSKDDIWRHHNRFETNPSHVVLPQDGELRERMPDNFIGPFFMFSRKVAEVLGQFARVQGVEDYDYWLRCERVGPIKHIGNPVPHYQYRVHKNTLSSQFRELKIVENVKNLIEVQEVRDRYTDDRKFTAEITERYCQGFRAPTTWATRRANPFTVLFLVDTWGVGGLEVVVKNQVLYFLGVGCKVQVVCSDLLDDEPPIELADIFFVAKTKQSFSDLLLHLKPDIAIAHYSYSFLHLLDEAEIPFLQTFHNTYVWLDSEEIKNQDAANINSKLNICVSKSVAEYLAQGRETEKGKIVVAPNGIDTSTLDFLQSQRVASDHPRLIVASTFTPHKRQLQILEAFYFVLKKYPKAKIVFVGQASNPNYREEVIRKIGDLGIRSSAEVHDFTKSMEIHYSQSDIAVSASMFEGWSLSLTEAAYLGMPIVATNVGGASDLGKFTKIYLVKNYPSSLVDVKSSELFDYSYKTPNIFTKELSLQIESAISDFYSTDSPIENRITKKWEINADYSSSQYYDYCVRVLNDQI